MYEFISDLLKTIADYIYWPILQSFEESDVIHNILSGFNSLLEALFGNPSTITIEELAAFIALIFLIIVIVIIVNALNYFMKMFEMKGNKRRWYF